MTETSFYPVLFAVSHALEALAWLIWCHGLQLPIERPKSVKTEELIKMAAKPTGEKPKGDIHTR
jgi:citrate synthase